MQTFRVQIAGVEANQTAVLGCDPGDSVKVYGDRNDTRYWLVKTSDGDELGLLPRRGKLIDALLGGGRMIGAEVQGISGPTASRDHATLSLNIQVADPDEDSAYLAGLAAVRAMSTPEPVAPSYPVAVVGVSHHQDAIGRCAVGEPVTIEPEPDNPHDSEALAVLSAQRELLGHIGRDSWVRRAIHDEARECSARITTIERNEAGLLRLVLEVSA